MPKLRITATCLVDVPEDRTTEEALEHLSAENGYEAFDLLIDASSHPEGADSKFTCKVEEVE